MPTWTSFHHAESALLARRREQRGALTLGDDADRALALALAGLPAEARDAARASGERVGSDVFARSYHEDALPRALDLLSASLYRAGFGSLEIGSSFHRSARVRYHPAGAMAEADRAVREGFLEGILRGFLSHSYNCRVDATALGDGMLDVHLREGRDVNAARRGRAS